MAAFVFSRRAISSAPRAAESPRGQHGHRIQMRPSEKPQGQSSAQAMLQNGHQKWPNSPAVREKLHFRMFLLKVVLPRLPQEKELRYPCKSAYGKVNHGPNLQTKCAHNDPRPGEAISRGPGQTYPRAICRGLVRLLRSFEA